VPSRRQADDLVAARDEHPDQRPAEHAGCPRDEDLHRDRMLRCAAVTGIALVRGVPPSMADCELTFVDRQPIDVPRAVAQHRAYAEALTRLGLELLELPADPRLPDCCFVEDTAVVLDEVAVIARPGAESRRPEVEPVAEALARFRPLRRVAAPACLDGGDVLAVGRRLFVGESRRTDAAGMRALVEAVRPFAYEVVPVALRGCLHLKSAVTTIAEDAVIVNPEWTEVDRFEHLDIVPVPPDEPWAANVLRVGGAVAMHAGFPRTAEALSKRGLDVRPIDVSEFLKAEAGVTCKSLLFAAC
jgi:dimethylargininase